MQFKSFHWLSHHGIYSALQIWKAQFVFVLFVCIVLEGGGWGRFYF